MDTTLGRALETVEAAITPTRNFNTLYIIIDSIFVLTLLGLLLWKRRNSTVLFALFGGVLYTVVDYCGFYLASGSREVFIDGVLAGAGGTFWVLLWMSMSYGITNFAFMWVLMAKDKLAKYWIFLICMWWMICPSIAEMGGAATIMTTRTVGAYHGWMGVVMVTQYLLLTILLIRDENKKPFVGLLTLCLIGFCVQFGWEFSLLVNGIRPMNAASFKTLIVNSCMETNMCMPTTYAVYYFWSRHFHEDMRRVKREPISKA